MEADSAQLGQLLSLVSCHNRPQRSTRRTPPVSWSCQKQLIGKASNMTGPCGVREIAIFERAHCCFLCILWVHIRALAPETIQMLLVLIRFLDPMSLPQLPSPELGTNSSSPSLFASSPLAGGTWHTSDTKATSYIAPTSKGA